MLVPVAPSLFALEVTIGAGDVNDPYPMDFHWPSSLYQTLFYPDELGFSSGTITALEFYNSFTDNLLDKPTLIWLGTTDLADLSGGFIPATQLTLVFDGMVDYPVGENAISITLEIPYTHSSGNLVMLVQRPLDSEEYSIENKFKCQTGGYTRSRYHLSFDFAANPYNPPMGRNIAKFPKTKITYTPQVIVNDLAAVSISGEAIPNVGTSYNYTIGIKNNGSAIQSNYQVRLMSGNTELASVAGPILNSLETAQVVIPWTPTTVGNIDIFGEVVLPGDEIATNNVTAPLNLLIQAENIHVITIGEGDELARIPIDFYYYSSLFQCLYYPDELGMVSGTIDRIAFYNFFDSDCPTGTTKIWLGNTTAQDLSDGWIPLSQMTLVYNGNVQYPTGQNTIVITLQTPFNFSAANLVLMVQRPWHDDRDSYADHFKCQTSPILRSLKMCSHTDECNPPRDGSSITTEISGQFPKTTFFFTGQPIGRDLSVHSLIGNATPSVGTAENYSVTVKNNGTVTETNYQVKLMMGDVELASVNGPTIQSRQTLEVSIPWTPTATGNMSIYGKVVMAGDQIAINNQTLPLNLVVQAAGVVNVTVGEGDSIHRIPFDFFWGNSLFETIYQASELNIGGAITGIKFYSQFTQEVGNRPVKIWLGETTQVDLSGGYIPASALNPVFDGSIMFHIGSNEIFIPIDPPWIYGGGNLVMLTNHPMENPLYYTFERFVTHTGAIANRSRNAYSNTINYDPYSPPEGFVSNFFPKTTFYLMPDGVGVLSGTVSGPGSVPISGATVSVANSSLSCITGADGTYHFPRIRAGSQTVSATKHGYTVATHTVNIVEDQTSTQNFSIATLPQVTVSGRIVGSDAPSVGLAYATLTLGGYDDYSITTNTLGQFTIPNVWGNQTYQYLAVAAGYDTEIGQAAVGTSDLNLGDIIVDERAFPAVALQAVENDAFTQVSLSWEAPDPTAVEITEGFEDETFPPAGWSRIITNTESCELGMMAYWTRMGALPYTDPVTPPEGDWHAVLGATGYHPQDEWLITPQFVCPSNGVLIFDTHKLCGSPYGDHYYVKVSTDDGANWTVLWDASALPVEWNCYDTPITVSLNAYAGQRIKLAWHGLSGPADGLFSIWLIDNIFIGNADSTIRFHTSESTSSQAGNCNLSTAEIKGGREMVGYRIWRLLQGQEDNEAAWTCLTPSNITQTNYTDTTWQPLPTGVYRFAVKAVYSNNIHSEPVFSNEVHKGMVGLLSGSVTDYGTGLAVADAVITAGEYSGTTNAQGVYSFRVYAGTYEVTCSKDGYQTATQTGVAVVGTQTTIQNFALIEIAYAPEAVFAEETADGSSVSLTWNEPGTYAGEWLGYCGAKYHNFPVYYASTFSIAVRYPAAALSDYAGMSLYAVKVWPVATSNFAIKVWTGGTANDAGTPVLEQPFAAELGVYNTIMLNEPVAVTGAEELWFGCKITTPGACCPVGCDGGPGVDRLGNLVNYGSGWVTLAGSGLNCNWCIEGYLGYSAPVDAPYISLGSLERPPFSSELNIEREANRALTGYRVWRLLQGQEDNEAAWTSLTASTITQTSFTDNSWQVLPSGVYKFAVKAIYTNEVLSNPVFSNQVHKDMLGTLTGVVTASDTGQPIAGAVVKAGEYRGTTNAQGLYSFSVYAGTYNVTCSKSGYQTYCQSGVVIIETQTTTQNLVLTEMYLPPLDVVAEAVDGELNINWQAPEAVNMGLEEGFEGDSFPPPDWEQVINSGDTGAYGSMATWCRLGTVPLHIPVPPPDGDWQAALWWSRYAQNEWLITPEFYCPPAGHLVFDSYVFLGSTDGDHYYVKVSTNGGNNWQTLWDASTQSGGWNRYDTPVSVSLQNYAGRQIKLAFQALSAAGRGLRYIWFIDNVEVESDAQTVKLDLDQCLAKSGIQRAAAEEEAGVRKASSSAVTKEVKKGERALSGYKVWRLYPGQENNESSWTSLTAEPVTATAIQDPDWATITDGTYKWAVKAVYTGGIVSPPAFSNALPKITEIGTLTGVVKNSEMLPVAGATINCAGFTATTNGNGIYSMQVNAGTYNVSASHPNYATSIRTGVIIVNEQVTTVNFILQPSLEVFEDGFESYDDFVIEFAPWTLVDLDQDPISGILTGSGQQVQFPNAEAPQAYIIFNPSACIPALTVEPHGGSKFAACIVAIPGPNDDWMITPLLEGVSRLCFWARSFHDYCGLEKFRVGVSTTGTQPSDFTIISGSAPVSAPIAWTEYSYDLDEYFDVPVYLAIQCVSSDVFIFMVDDVRVTGGTDADDPVIPVFTTALHPNYPNPFNPETTISYSLSQGENVKIEVYNVKGQLVRTLVNEAKPAGEHTVVWRGVDHGNRPVSSGVYYYRMTAGIYSITKKMLLMK